MCDTSNALYNVFWMLLRPPTEPIVSVRNHYVHVAALVAYDMFSG